MLAATIAARVAIAVASKCTATIGWEGYWCWWLNYISVYWAISAESANKFSSLSSLVCSDERVLFALASFEFECLIFCCECGDFIIGQEIKDCTGSCVLVVDDVASAILNSIASIASLSCHVVVDVFQRALNCCGLISNVVVYAVDVSLDVAAKLLSYKFFILYFLQFPVSSDYIFTLLKRGRALVSGLLVSILTC